MTGHGQSWGALELGLPFRVVPFEARGPGLWTPASASYQTKAALGEGGVTLGEGLPLSKVSQPAAMPSPWGWEPWS